MRLEADEVTFAIAKLVDPDVGKLTLLSDTKITDQNDETSNRRALSNPGQKVVIVDDDIVVAFAGDTPASAVNRVAELRGQSFGKIEDSLLSLSAELYETVGASKSFLIVTRKPESRIIVISRGKREDRSAIRTGWIGDPEGFRAFSEVFHDGSSSSETGLEERFFIAMTGLIAWEDVQSVGGYLVRVSGSRDKPFRFMPDTGVVLPDDIEGMIVRKPGQQATMGLALADRADPTVHVRLPIPGTGSTYGALAHYIPEAGTAWLHTHERPGDAAAVLKVSSLEELVNVAESEYGQHLDPAVAQRVLQGQHPAPSMLYMRPYPAARPADADHPTT